VGRALCVLIGCAGVAAAPVTAKARELQAAQEPASGAAEGATSEAAVSVATATRSPAVEVFTANKVRHDWYFGAGFGLGAGNFQASAGASAAVMGLMRVGGRLTDKVGMGGALVSSLGGTNTGGSGFTNLLAEALFFPVKGRGLGVAVGLGISSAWSRESATDGTVIERATQTGAGFGLGLGYDFWLARRFNLGLWLRSDGSGGRYGLRASGTLGLMLSWYCATTGVGARGRGRRPRAGAPRDAGAPRR
jgi:hypothetical protein